MDHYTAVKKYLDDCAIFGIKPGLIRIKRILSILGNPHKSYDCIHIVGTNGKTSATRILANILNYQNIKTGYYISPHIDSYTERMWISGSEVTEHKFVKIFNKIYPYIEEVNKMDLDGPLTQFEILTAMAFLLGREENLEVMVLEAGMGGRWDATNIADSKVVGLTGVSLEHTQMLGSTIGKIAQEKAEVIKKDAPVATLSGDNRVLNILNRKVSQTGSDLFIYGNNFKITKKKKDNLNGWFLDIDGITKNYKNLKLPLLGVFQPANLSLAIALAELYLKICNKELKEDLLAESLKNLSIRGRFEIIKRKPMVILDASHNPEGLKIFVKNLNEYFPEGKKIIIFSVLKDKDYRKMISYILKISDMLILTSSLKDRSLGIDKLEVETKKILLKRAKKSQKIPEYIYKIDNLKNSLNFTLKISKSNDIICITGSITNLEGIKDIV